MTPSGGYMSRVAREVLPRVRSALAASAGVSPAAGPAPASPYARQ